MSDLRVLTDTDAPAELLGEIRRLVAGAFDGDFTAEDWQHTLGGWRVVSFDGDAPVAHAAVVPRRIEVGERPFRAGYVEGVAVHRERRRGGHGSVVIARATRLIRESFELGALSTGIPELYERFGWERWRGPSFVRDAGALVRTPDEDEGLMALRFGPSAGIGLDEPISCDARSGDDW